MTLLRIVLVLVSVTGLLLSLAAAGVDIQLRVRRDLFRLLISTASVVGIGVTTGVDTSLAALGVALLLGVGIGSAIGNATEVWFENGVTWCRREGVGIVIWGLSVVAMQSAGYLNRASIVTLGQAVAAFGIGSQVGTMLGRSGPVSRATAGRVLSGAAMVLLAVGLATSTGQMVALAQDYTPWGDYDNRSRADLEAEFANRMAGRGESDVTVWQKEVCDQIAANPARVYEQGSEVDSYCSVSPSNSGSFDAEVTVSLARADESVAGRRSRSDFVSQATAQLRGSPNYAEHVPPNIGERSVSFSLPGIGEAYGSGYDHGVLWERAEFSLIVAATSQVNAERVARHVDDLLLDALRAGGPIDDGLPGDSQTGDDPTDGAGQQDAVAGQTGEGDQSSEDGDDGRDPGSDPGSDPGNDADPDDPDDQSDSGDETEREAGENDPEDITEAEANAGGAVAAGASLVGLLLTLLELSDTPTDPRSPGSSPPDGKSPVAGSTPQPVTQQQPADPGTSRAGTYNQPAQPPDPPQLRQPAAAAPELAPPMDREWWNRNPAVPERDSADARTPFDSARPPEEDEVWFPTEPDPPVDPRLPFDQYGQAQQQELYDQAVSEVIGLTRTDGDQAVVQLNGLDFFRQRINDGTVTPEELAHLRATRDTARSVNLGRIDAAEAAAHTENMILRGADLMHQVALNGTKAGAGLYGAAYGGLATFIVDGVQARDLGMPRAVAVGAVNAVLDVVGTELVGKIAKLTPVVGQQNAAAAVTGGMVSAGQYVASVIARDGHADNVDSAVLAERFLLGALVDGSLKAGQNTPDASLDALAQLRPQFRLDHEAIGRLHRAVRSIVDNPASGATQWWN